MSNSDYEDEFEPLEETTKQTKPKSPFGTESDVDYIVYRPPSDSPELRSEAAYVPVAPKLQIRDAAPIKPQTRVYSAWTPGSSEEETESKPKPPARSKTSTALRYALIAVVSLAPIIVVLLVTKYALSLYSG